MHTRPVWAEISRPNLIANYLELRKLAGDQTQLLAVVKADAYGHGMRHCAPLLVEAGAEWIGVTSVEEGVSARKVCPLAKILVMSGVWNGEADALLEHRLTPIAWEEFHLDLIEAAARRLALSPQSVAVHLELDTGMSRQGVSVQRDVLSAVLHRFAAESPLRLDGLATHFSAPEVLDGTDTREQTTRFLATLDWIVSQGHRPRWIHVGNSATILRGGQVGLVRAAAERMGATLMLRPGLSLYGYAPRFTESGEIVALARSGVAALRPALTWKTRITSLRGILPGDGVGYNSTFRAIHAAQLALLPMGYADGLSRLLSNRGSVLVRGQRAPILGRVSMDQTIVDVTAIPGVEIGEEVVVIGSQGDAAISAYDHADLTGTIPYEVLCGIAARVPRVLVD